MVNAKRTKNGTSKGNKVVKKKAYDCKDGPWIGRTLSLSTDTTMWMNIGGVDGRYVCGFWQTRKDYEDSA